MRLLLYVLVFLIPAAVHASGLPQAANVPGGIVLLTVQSTDGSRPRAFYNKRPVMLLAQGKQWLAVIGISLKTKAGDHQLTLRWDSGKTTTQHFTIQDKAYPTQHITLKDNSKVDLSKKDLERHQTERVQVNKALRTWSTPLPDMAFAPPVQGRYGQSFGKRRVINNKPRNPHKGMDVSAPAGTPVVAPSDAVVSLTGDFFFTGNVIYLDHGNGLISMYAHLSQIDVKPGQTVKKGQRIGAVGSTGRATGAHLHWAVYLTRTAVDPSLFLPEKTATAPTP